ncbi:MAG: L-glutamate gamma-semialdehyde dehydrogenase [Bacteroidales bacterium]|nr:L-glutamate gamma-semialdehyde dehydrogenase [Bacteroidales bacterium]
MYWKPIYVPEARNEPARTFAPGSPERASVKKALEEAYSTVIDIPMFIGGKEVRSGRKVPIYAPHDKKRLLGHYYQGDAGHVRKAIEAALAAKKTWESLHWTERAAIFLRAASLLSGPYRDKIVAATMIGQSKTVHQAEIDAACELADFFRFNVQYMEEILMNQPCSADHEWNILQQRPLEGFVFALTPFNFTSIAGNLPTAPALMGNTVVWKASTTQIYSAAVIMEMLIDAGVPDGVINLIFVPGPVAGNIILNHPDFAGIHYTGSTDVFQGIWKEIGNNIHKYKTYPRIVGETGGKDFVMAHPSAKAPEVVSALIRGAFEYQGQKCSAVSRAYIPESLWPDVRDLLGEDIASMRTGPPEDFRNFMCAVIDEASFDKLAGFIDRAGKDDDAEVIFGGGYNKSTGFFIEPTIILTSNPRYVTMEEELFGPILTIYVYEDDKFNETIELLDKTSKYALTGAFFSQDRRVLDSTTVRLSNAAGNFYINDKPTGAVVGRQPFGGSRASGTNDKAGSFINLLRWVSPRTVKENFIPTTDYRYPYMEEE